MRARNWESPTVAGLLNGQELLQCAFEKEGERKGREKNKSRNPPPPPIARGKLPTVDENTRKGKKKGSDNSQPLEEVGASPTLTFRGEGKKKEKKRGKRGAEKTPGLLPLTGHGWRGKVFPGSPRGGEEEKRGKEGREGSRYLQIFSGRWRYA